MCENCQQRLKQNTEDKAHGIGDQIDIHFLGHNF